MGRCSTIDEGPDENLHQNMSKEKVEVLKKSLEELRPHVIKTFWRKLKKITTSNMKKNLKSHSTMNEEMVKEANAKIGEMFAQNTQQPPTSCP
ncbi:hypothetical protein Tco_0358860 [Tanacetum coccineum]